ESRIDFNHHGDKSSVAFAMTRCVGVGECRKEEHGTMCPSYMVTRDEMHSTRGRAHLLFEMLEGNPLKGGWKDDHVREALDLCFACKACRSECPVNVDMATYKAEFLSHYYERRLRPVTAYTMGLVYWWSRAAAIAPDVANFILSMPLTKRLGGIAPERQPPLYARETFVERFHKRER